MEKTLPALPWSYFPFTSTWNQHIFWKSRFIFFSSTPLNKTLKLSLFCPTCLQPMCRNASFSQCESTCFCPNQGFVLDSAKEHRISKQQHWSQRQHSLQCPCSVRQHLWHIFYHNLYLQFHLYTVKERQPMAVKTYRCSYKDSNYSEVRKQKEKKSFKSIQNHTTEFWPPSPFILIFGIWYFTFHCSTGVTVLNKIILNLFVSPQQWPSFASD